MTSDHNTHQNRKKKDILLASYKKTRHLTELLTSKITPEDQTIQAMPDASPVKWHRAHTAWFFEQFILLPYLDGYKLYNAHFNYLFNSYYEGAGERYARNNRGLITRPDCDDVTKYRNYVDNSINEIITSSTDEVWKNIDSLIELGLHHEKQHQELILMDILNAFAQNPTYPAYQENSNVEKGSALNNGCSETKWIEFSGGLKHIGHNPRNSDTFAFDNEEPEHKAFISPFKIASKLATNLEWLEFIDAGGYETPMLWLADGWATARKENWKHPLYWKKTTSSEWSNFSLNGLKKLDLNAPVTHISFYEANAFARWKEKRLPSESEWELASGSCPMTGNLLSNNVFEALPSQHSEGLSQMIGDAWEYTQSPYIEYPGFRERKGSIGEYNGKFMSNQMVLRGGCCLTPDDHIRRTYRNFFYPHQRWMCSGIRLAEDN